LQNDVLTSIIENLKAINEISSDDSAVKISVAIIGEKFKIRN
jgi:1,4-alpha-glucan branching enzyme